MTETSPCRRLAVDHAVRHHQQALAVAFDHGAGLGVIDEIDALLARIGDENAAELAVRQPLADLDEQARRRSCGTCLPG